MKGYTLEELPGAYTVSRLEAGEPLPVWADGDGFVSISRSAHELSVVCRSERVPPDVRRDDGWICLRLAGPFAFDETGVVLSVIQPLSANGIGIFVVSTFDGDHLLFKRDDRAEALRYLQHAGHHVVKA